MEMLQSEVAVNIGTAATHARNEAREEAEQAKALLEKEHEAKLIQLKKVHDDILSQAIHEAHLRAVQDSETLHAELTQQLNEMKLREEGFSDEIRGGRGEQSCDETNCGSVQTGSTVLQQSAAANGTTSNDMNDELSEQVQKLQADAVWNLRMLCRNLDKTHSIRRRKRRQHWNSENEAKLNELRRENEVAILKAIQKAESIAANRSTVSGQSSPNSWMTCIRRKRR
jgi:hypothetical protein